MLGFDNKGTHFFGPHEAPLKNTQPHRFKTFAAQFGHLANRFKMERIEVLNCTPDTALDKFPIAILAEGLEWLSPLKSAA
jgi:hypothetical protein